MPHVDPEFIEEAKLLVESRRCLMTIRAEMLQVIHNRGVETFRDVREELVAFFDRLFAAKFHYIILFLDDTAEEVSGFAYLNNCRDICEAIDSAKHYFGDAWGSIISEATWCAENYLRGFKGEFESVRSQRSDASLHSVESSDGDAVGTS